MLRKDALHWSQIRVGECFAFNNGAFKGTSWIKVNDNSNMNAIYCSNGTSVATGYICTFDPGKLGPKQLRLVERVQIPLSDILEQIKNLELRK